jgi:hypothetical protein
MNRHHKLTVVIVKSDRVGIVPNLMSTAVGKSLRTSGSGCHIISTIVVIESLTKLRPSFYSYVLSQGPGANAKINCLGNILSLRSSMLWLESWLQASLNHVVYCEDSDQDIGIE